MKSFCHRCFGAATIVVMLAVGRQCDAQLLNSLFGPRQGDQFGAMDSQARQPTQLTQPTQPDALPASPLAGGHAAAQGDSFVNVHGDSIVMPASYCQSCPPGQCGCGAYGGGYGGAYADNGYVDFGGFGGADQCGPHYFDLMAGAVFLTSEDAFDGVGAFGSVGVDGPRILDPSQSLDDYEPGWQIAARVDLGPLSVLEGTYMGVYDMGFVDTVRSVDVAPGGQDFQLFSAPGYGLPTPIPGLDDGSVYSLGYESDLQSTEFSYRRYWVGHGTRASGTFLLGFRYVRLTEQLDFTAEALANQILLTTDTSVITWAGDNDLLGFQVGGDGWICILQGLRFGVEGKAGIYNNRFDFRNTGVYGSAPGAPADFDVRTRGDHVAFVGDGSASIVADILPSFSIRGGYRVLYMDRVASVGSNLDMTSLSAAVVGTPGGDALYHGFDASIEYVW